MTQDHQLGTSLRAGSAGVRRRVPPGGRSHDRRPDVPPGGKVAGPVAHAGTSGTPAAPTSTRPQIDEHTEAEVQPPCEADNCIRAAEWVARLSHRLDGTEIQPPILACHDHAEALEMHNQRCLFCRLWVQLVLEPINRRPS